MNFRHAIGSTAAILVLFSSTVPAQPVPAPKPEPKPAAKAEPKPEAKAPAAPAKAEVQAAAPRAEARPRRSRANEDARECLAFTTNTEIARCAEKFR